ncbi:MULTISPECIES: phosphatase PAP2 family protein [Rhodanobacter]|uniref:phosphatase PAP2 family protein n=1 Tax=Rhodanobacter TaxID=75309 RepID=UPI0004820D9B|nr:MULTISPECIES: phosphatase PAP2 family protein [Rhodanobacter]TAN18628.1 MAG: phosphatase PAP2 family protein [Rhodanobacter sp.]UJJ56370.1 phosphatase PAP2 family protein [Rhodanobacter thiooxydans]
MNTPPSLPNSELLPGPRFALDRRVCVIANHWGARRVVGACFGMVSRLGDGMFWYALMAALAAFGGQRGLIAATHMAVTGLAALLLYRVLKRWTRRPRPYRACPGVIAHVPPLDEFSFPSGHTLQAVGFSIVALAWYPALAPLLLGFTALVAASRVILGLHYPSDVLAAIVIGGMLGGASLWLAGLPG